MQHAPYRIWYDTPGAELLGMIRNCGEYGHLGALPQVEAHRARGIPHCTKTRVRQLNID